MLSERTITKFQGITTCATHGHRAKDLFQMILNAPDLWAQAYGNIASNKGGMTPGVDGLTLDGYSEERAGQLREQLRANRYVPSPVKRVYIPKPNGKQRPLGMPTANDTLVQEVWRMILEAIYEPVFKASSHGFRPKRSCHTALRDITYWTGTKWFIEFDIEGYFDNIDHKVLMRLLEKRIDDTKFLNVIRKMLKAGYMENWKFHNSYSDTPQGGIISPILANIYLHELDGYIEQRIVDFNKGNTRRNNLEYRKVVDGVARLNKQLKRVQDLAVQEDLLKRKKALQQQARTMPSQDQHDPHYRRLRYCRYADDFLLGAVCSKSEAEDIAKKITDFLREELKLSISPTKSGIKHHTEIVRFLGYDITVNNTERAVKVIVKGQPTRRRSLKAQITLKVPEDKLRQFAVKHGYGHWDTNHAVHRPVLTLSSDVAMALQYSAELRGIAQYYALASNYSSALSRLRSLGVMSFFKTMAAKHQKSLRQVMTMLNRGGYFAVEAQGKEYRLLRVKDVKRTAVFAAAVDVPPRTFHYTSRSELLQRMNAKTCESCGKEGGSFEVHHVRKLADMKAGKEPWEKLMIARRRKTLVLCVDCHHKLTHGKLPDRRQVS